MKALLHATLALVVLAQSTPAVSQSEHVSVRKMAELYRTDDTVMSAVHTSIITAFALRKGEFDCRGQTNIQVAAAFAAHVVAANTGHHYFDDERAIPLNAFGVVDFAMMAMEQQCGFKWRMVGFE